MITSKSDAQIHSDVQRYFWAAYHLFVFLSSLIGDSLILYSSFQKDAFKLNRLLVMVIRHIAVSDLTYAMFSVLPSAIALISDSWVYTPRNLRSNNSKS